MVDTMILLLTTILVSKKMRRCKKQSWQAWILNIKEIIRKSVKKMCPRNFKAQMP
jgi:hypothetical protein